jgi:YbgC/YbaW family acyl-CoA thioester hydrolase
MAGIVHFANYLRYMEEAEHALLRSLAINVFEPIADGIISWPRVSVHCDYHRPARFGDVVNIAVTVENLAKKSVTYAFSISANGETLATGRTVAVCCRVGDSEQLESIAIPERIAAKLAGVRSS